MLLSVWPHLLLRVHPSKLGIEDGQATHCLVVVCRRTVDGQSPIDVYSIDLRFGILKHCRLVFFLLMGRWVALAGGLDGLSSGAGVVKYSSESDGIQKEL